MSWHWFTEESGEERMKTWTWIYRDMPVKTEIRASAFIVTSLDLFLLLFIIEAALLQTSFCNSPPGKSGGLHFSEMRLFYPNGLWGYHPVHHLVESHHCCHSRWLVCQEISKCSFGNISFRKNTKSLRFQTAASVWMWGDHRAVTHCTCRQGCLGLLALLMMIMIPLGRGRPSLQLGSFLCKDEVIGGEGRDWTGEGERGERSCHICFLGAKIETSLPRACLIITDWLVGLLEKGMERQADGEEL